ncbi:phage tail protein [Photobacterium phosphoreum]|uniref:phage tail-collar fiber domain-containing protein n=1 Tax=Photobacterium phosphoreum TaxID=659 RepID=UPI001E2BE4AA|nr:phage tail protein [Photobacterium phosphoreum]MCD9511945.1 hypothetical protein [Photobacterium phosphoreum]
MAQAVIPLSFEKYIQKKLTAGEAVTLNKMVLANIPDLDISKPIPRNTELPDVKYIVHEQVIDQVGKVNTNALAYSIVMDTKIGDFTFNAMYLIDKDDPTTVAMIVWKLPEDKIATNAQEGTTGNSLVKSMLMEYDGAAQAAAITVDAATWQIDYSARLIGMDDDLRKQALDIYGHDAFIDDGFNVSKAINEGEYHVQVGLGYIGGLRAELSQQQMLIIANKPTAIYAVVSREGTVLGAWKTTAVVRANEMPLSDHKIDGVQYYVAKIADINSDGSVVDMRSKTQFDLLLDEIHKSQFLEWDASRIYKKGEKVSKLVSGEFVDYWCNKQNVNISPNDDDRDSWRKYPYDSLKNQGVSIEYWFDGKVIVNGFFEIETIKIPHGSGVSVFDGAMSFNLPTPLSKVTGYSAVQNDSSSVGAETVSCGVSGDGFYVRAGGVTTSALAPDKYIARGSFSIVGVR